MRDPFDARIRIGVGEKPSADSDLANHVLGHFNSEDAALMQKAAETAAEAIGLAIREDLDAAMNRFNTKKADKKAEKKAEKEAAEKAAEEAKDKAEGANE